MTEEKEEIWTAEAVTAEMIEEVAVVTEEAAVAEIEEVVVAVQEAAVVEEVVADPVVEAAVRVEEVGDLEVEAVAEVEEDKVKIENKIYKQEIVTRNFIKCYNRKERNTGKCRKAV